MYVQREIEERIFDWMNEREIIAIIGPRQSGKTTLLERIKERVTGSGLYDVNHVVYLTLDDEMERLRFEEDPVDHINGNLIDSGPHLFLLDEVQYLEKAGNLLKLVFDRYSEKVKFIITGSCSPDLRDIGGSLVGRVVFFELYPFSFQEFLLARDEKMQRYYLQHRVDIEGEWPDRTGKPVMIDRLNLFLREYMTYGGFPRIVLMNDVGKKELLLRQLITLYIEKDILKIYGQPFRNDALRIVQYLAFHCGGMQNSEGISSDLGIDSRKVKETIDILEESFLIKRIRPYFRNLTTELRKRNKIYFIDNGIRNVLADDFVFSKEKGFLLENHIFSQLYRKDEKLKYWRTTAKAEVDFVINDSIPIEVKSTPRLTRSLRSFLSTYRPSKGLMINYDTMETRRVEETDLLILPASLL